MFYSIILLLNFKVNSQSSQQWCFQFNNISSPGYRMNKWIFNNTEAWKLHRLLAQRKLTVTVGDFLDSGDILWDNLFSCFSFISAIRFPPRPILGTFGISTLGTVSADSSFTFSSSLSFSVLGTATNNQKINKYIPISYLEVSYCEFNTIKWNLKSKYFKY